MNPWDVLWLTVGWFLLGLLGICGLLLAWGVCLGLIQAIRKHLPKREPKTAREVYLFEAKQVGLDTYKHEVGSRHHEVMQAFQDGARWGWDTLHSPK